MIGKTLAHYEILERLGSGGMGEVYRARDTRLDRDVALKVLPARAASAPGFRERFEQEARTVASLNHPNIVTIHSIEKVADTAFMTMEIVRGTTLAEIIAEGPVDAERFFEIAVPLISALAAVHSRGIIHRDLKPGNVLVNTEGQVKLLDFGIAKIAESLLAGEDDETSAALTREGSIVGTVPYMSPEQVQGRPVDPRSDIFSLGIIFYELLSGAHPFPGDSPAQTVTAIIRDAPPAISSLDDSLEYAVWRCLEKTPGGRWNSMDALGAYLGELRQRPCGVDPQVRGIPEGVPGLLETGSWQEALDILSEASARGELSPRGQEYLADAAFWLNRMEVCLQALEAAHAGYVDLKEIESANRTALSLTEYYLLRDSPAIGNGWLRKAERGIQDTPESPNLGYLHRLKAKLAFERDHDPDTAWNHAVQALEVARRVKDRDLEFLAIQDQGRIQVARGDTEEGMALLDEAMAAAMSGELHPQTVGITYCNMITTCKHLADYRRAGEWSDAGEQWCSNVSESVFPGMCQIYRAEVMRLRGDWEDAEAHILGACEQLGETHYISPAAFYELGELRLRRGEFAEAEKAFQKAHRLGRDPVPGLALLRSAQGKHEAAARLIDRALKEDVTVPLDRAQLLPYQVELSLAAGNLEAAVAATEELERIALDYSSPAFAAKAAQAKGTLDLGRNHPEPAAGHLRRAVKLWRECDLPYDEARARALLARAYRSAGSPEDAELELSAARETFEALGAKPDLDALAEQERQG